MMSWKQSGGVSRRLPTQWSEWRRTGWQIEVREDLLDRERVQDGDDGLQLAAKQPAARDCTRPNPAPERHTLVVS